MIKSGYRLKIEQIRGASPACLQAELALRMGLAYSYCPVLS